MMERIGAEAMANSMHELRDGKELFILNPVLLIIPKVQK